MQTRPKYANAPDSRSPFRPLRYKQMHDSAHKRRNKEFDASGKLVPPVDSEDGYEEMSKKEVSVGRRPAWLLLALD